MTHRAGVVARRSRVRVGLLGLVLAGLAALMLADPTLAQQPGTVAVDTGGAEVDLGAGDLPQSAVNALILLLVLSILIESGLAVVFDWRVYSAYLGGRALKPVFAVIVSFTIVRTFELDILASLITSNTASALSSFWVTELLTALIIAGGSGGVNKILKTLGVRTRYTPPEPPSQDKAWIAVKVVRGREIVGPVRVAVTEVAASGQDLPALAGATHASKPSLRSILLGNADRFPQNGGYEVIPDKAYTLSVMGETHSGTAIRADVVDQPVKLAKGAVVDFQVRLGTVDRK